MTATLSDIKGFLARAVGQKARWLLVGLDTYDYDNYPIFVKEDEDPWVAYEEVHARGDRVDEVYDLDLPIGGQLAEHRANHMPPRSPLTEGVQ